MGRFPVFQSPTLDQVEQNMASCRPWHRGFLGNDERKLVEILNDDQAEVNSLGLTHKVIADRLRELSSKAKEGWGEPVCVDGKFLVVAEDARGKIASPWADGIFPKTHVELINTETNEKLRWSDLSIHLIEKHGFYQGKGSYYRLDPSKLKRVLAL